MMSAVDSRDLPATRFRSAFAVALAGMAAIGISATVAPERAWAGALLTAYYLLTLGLGGAVFIAVANVTGAGWHTAIRRVPEALAGLLPVGGLLVLTLLFVQLPRYSWHAHGHGDPGTFWFKERWLSPAFLSIRAVVYVGLWFAFTTRLVSMSRIRTGCLLLHRTARESQLPPSFWLCLPSPFRWHRSTGSWHWNRSGSAPCGVFTISPACFRQRLAGLVIGGVFLRRNGPLQGVFRDEHLHDLGKLLLGFSCFWMYIWFCQYMLIWYSNIPEETVYFARRLQGGWGPMVIASLVLNWVIPFFVLLPRESKRSEKIMLRVAWIVLIGRWIDLSVMIYPPWSAMFPLWEFLKSPESSRE
ncbi:MAG: hypothetical protein R3C19_24725 [Planctomycetaceae bacterium]